MLRVIAGEFGGRRIRAPGGRGTRPTKDAVREAWFNALGPEVADASVVDLYAGSGALGIEALSRGARSACFVERQAGAVSVLTDNLRLLGLEPRSQVMQQDVSAFVAARPGSGQPEFDIALADPPYGTGDALNLVEAFRAHPFSRMLCVEHAPDSLGSVHAVWRRRYGETELSFFVMGEGEAHDER